MHAFLDTRSFGGIMARLPHGLGIDGLISAVVVVARKEPDPVLSP